MGDDSDFDRALDQVSAALAAMRAGDPQPYDNDPAAPMLGVALRQLIMGFRCSATLLAPSPQIQDQS